MNPRIRTVALATPAEFLVVDVIAQHDPEPNAELPGGRDAGFPHALLSEFSTIEPLQRRVTADGRHGGITPEES